MTDLESLGEVLLGRTNVYDLRLHLPAGRMRIMEIGPALDTPSGIYRVRLEHVKGPLIGMPVWRLMNLDMLKNFLPPSVEADVAAVVGEVVREQ